ncbi:hypothetical protein CHARACLAT_002840, partial [Characodon lateralis]|nr:hypothetical protein [Characodon lateralis]
MPAVRLLSESRCSTDRSIGFASSKQSDFGRVVVFFFCFFCLLKIEKAKKKGAPALFLNAQVYRSVCLFLYLSRLSGSGSDFLSLTHTHTYTHSRTRFFSLFHTHTNARTHPPSLSLSLSPSLFLFFRLLRFA